MTILTKEDYTNITCKLFFGFYPQNNMNEIEQFKYYTAIINYHKINDLKENTLPNRTKVYVRPVWKAEDDEKFAGDWIFEIAENEYWLPERDLSDFKESTYEEFKNKRK
jgi:hypothetical protein